MEETGAELVIKTLRWTTDSNNDRRRVVEVLLHPLMRERWAKGMEGGPNSRSTD
jgi:hypothetical protein